MLLIAIISLAFVFDGNRYYYSRILLFNQRKLSNFLYDSMRNTVLCRMGRLLFHCTKYTENNHRLNFMDNRGNQEATNLHKSRSKAK